MNNIVDFSSYRQKLVCEEVGSVSISMYKEATTGLPFFHVEPENEDVLPLSRAIENVLENFKSV